MKPADEPWQLDRLSAEEAPELHRAIGVAKQAVPSASELAALAASLSAHGLPLSGTPSAASAARATAQLRKIWAIIGAALLGAAALVATRQRVSPAQRSTSRPAAVASEHAVLAGTASARASTQRTQPIAQSSATATPPAPSSAEAIAAPGAAAAGSAPPAIGPEPSATFQNAPVPRPALEPTALSGRSFASSRASSSPTSHTPSGGLVSGARAQPSELELLRDARLALQSSPALALGLTDQHSALYPRGAMAQERELIAISALSRLGRHAAVLSRARSFEHDFPGSPYRKQIAQLAH